MTLKTLVYAIRTAIFWRLPVNVFADLSPYVFGCKRQKCIVRKVARKLSMRGLKHVPSLAVSTMSKKTIKLISAGVAQPNTHETDALERVDHIATVTFIDGTKEEMRVCARCPQHAIEMAREYVTSRKH